MKPLITLEQARQLWRYAPETGELIWKQMLGRARPGQAASTMNEDGYVLVMAYGRRYPVHRIAWFMVKSEWPQYEIDHKNGVRSDNRIDNLRDVPTEINKQNQRSPQSRNLSGFLGVSKRGKKFRADLSIKGRNCRLGVFETVKEAHAAYIEAKRKHHIGCTL